MTDEEIIRGRWAAQGLGNQSGATPLEVVSGMLAMQAQDILAVQWAVGSRAGCSEAEVVAAIEAGRIVRSWPMRGTLHLMAAEDVGWMVGLLAPIMLARADSRLRELGLDTATLSKAEQIFTKALAKGPVTREALLRELELEGYSVTQQRGYLTLWFHAHRGLLCCGPRQGKKQTFALAESWLPSTPVLTREEALARLATCYFRSHGPATAHDLANWTALPLRDAKHAAELASSDLVCHKVGRKLYWSGDISEAAPVTGVRLLAGFDEYMLGYKDRSHVLNPEHATRVVPGANGVFKPLIVVDGRIVGTWSRKLKSRVVEVAFQPFEGGLDADALRREAEVYARFLGLDLVVI